MPNNFILIPGIGSQGGSFALAKSLFDVNGSGALISVSRDITYTKDKYISYENYEKYICERVEWYLEQCKKL